MNILKKLEEHMKLSPLYILNEIEKAPISTLKPKDFTYNIDSYNIGEYTFKVEYNEDGEDKDLMMVVDIDTYDNDKEPYTYILDISFNEADNGLTYNAVQRGTSHREIFNVIKNKMNGIMYCIYHHIKHMTVEGRGFSFEGTFEEKDKNISTNRRNKLYLSFLNKYLPDLGIKILNVEENEDNSVVVYTTPFGKLNDTKY